MSPPEAFLTTCKEAALAAGECLMEHFGHVRPREKGPADLVTEADLAAQEAVCRVLEAAYPEHEILAEEGPRARLGESADVYRWVVDPLDGTTNFVHAVPHFAVSVALTHGQEVLAAAAFNPVSREFFTASQGGGAFLNEEPIRTSQVHELGGALAAIGFPPGEDGESADVKAFLKALPRMQAMRRTGSAALNLAYVAAGRFDAAWSFATRVWDMAAGVLLVQEAGGHVTNTDGSPLDLMAGHFLAAANQPLHAQVVALLEGR
ncbi:MAG: inositol monophosphatase [Pirellulales bacterium]|nr:inositol monophosphatase [Pirellulales bacterium]